MIISLQWLNQYLDRPVDADEADRLLTDAGFPLDGRTDLEDGDVALDVEVTSNRPDCLSHIGVAREIAAASDRSLKLPQTDLEESSDSPAVDQLTRVDNQATDLCPVYTARVIRGVKVGPSPAWLGRHIEAIGLRPVNNVVDITNFVLHEMGQPLHAFDMARLDGGCIVVRRASQGEAFTAIDNSKHELTDAMLVIADAHMPVAIAGVMGGLDSEVGDQTTDILLESARFDPLSVRSTSRALKLASDSSYRFERGVDPAGVEAASRRAAQLIVEIAGGQLAPGVIRQGEATPPPHEVQVRPGRVNALLGYDLSADRMVGLLDALGLSPKADGELIACTIPSHRLDLHREADLVEEIARLHGYDAIPTAQAMRVRVRPAQPSVEVRRLIGQVLVAHGYHETITFSFTAPGLAEPFMEAGEELIELDDERRAAEPALRPSLLPSLLTVRKTNQDAGNRDVRLFEVARTFSKRDGAYHEMKELALLADGETDDALRQIRGTLEELGEQVGCPLAFVAAQELPNWTKAAGWITPAAEPERIIGQYGAAGDAVLDRFDLKTPVTLAWIDYDRLVADYPPQPAVAALPKYPAIERDLSIVVDEQTPWQAIARTIDEAGPTLLERVEYVGVYRGKQVGPGRKSVTFRLSFRDPDKTLRHEEVDPQVNKVVEALADRHAAELRAG